MACLFCKKYRDAFWIEVHSWDDTYSFYWDTFDEEPDGDALLAAHKKWHSDPASAFFDYRVLADNGSLLAHFQLAECFALGHGAEQNHERAIEHYLTAAKGGSWSSYLHYSHFLAKNGYQAEAIEALEEGVEAEIYPFYFWLAWRLHQFGKGRARYQRIDDLLKKAEQKGHPAAQLYWARFATTGKFGLRKVLRGFAELGKFMKKQMSEPDHTEEKSVSELT